MFFYFAFSKNKKITNVDFLLQSEHTQILPTAILKLACHNFSNLDCINSIPPHSNIAREICKAKISVSVCLKKREDRRIEKGDKNES